MNMEEVKAFMKEVGWGDLATSDGKVVGVRPMGGWAWVEGELWCASAIPTAKTDQLAAVPYAEYCFNGDAGKHARIAGPCTVSTDAGDKQTLYNAVPGIHGHVDGPTGPGWAVLRLKPERVRMISPDFTYEEVPLD